MDLLAFQCHCVCVTDSLFSLAKPLLGASLLIAMKEELRVLNTSVAVPPPPCFCIILRYQELAFILVRASNGARTSSIVAVAVLLIPSLILAPTCLFTAFCPPMYSCTSLIGLTRREWARPPKVLCFYCDWWCGIEVFLLWLNRL